jgi:hypothetical protein
LIGDFAVKFHVLFLISAAALSPVEGMARAYLGSDDVQYTSVTNSHGMVLKSPQGDISLGNSCDAYSPVHGKGTWEWANGGFIVSFPHITIGFARQEVEINNNGGCSMKN